MYADYSVVFKSSLSLNHPLFFFLCVNSEKKYQVSQRTHCTCIKLNLIDNFNISTVKKKHMRVNILLIQPLYGMKKNRLQGACCHSPEMLGIKMLSFERKLQEQT